MDLRTSTSIEENRLPTPVCFIIPLRMTERIVGDRILRERRSRPFLWARIEVRRRATEAMTKAKDR